MRFRSEEPVSRACPELWRGTAPIMLRIQVDDEPPCSPHPVRSKRLEVSRKPNVKTAETLFLVPRAMYKSAETVC
jgi:hypothetical protein